MKLLKKIVGLCLYLTDILSYGLESIRIHSVNILQTLKKMFGITTPGLKAPVLPSAAVSITDVNNSARNLFPFPPTGIDMSISVVIPAVANSK